MLTLYLRENPFSNRKKPYAWHAQSEGRISHDKLIDTVANANTTVTKADVLAVITEYERQVTRALQEGFSVESFFGTLSVGATGSAEKGGERHHQHPGAVPENRPGRREQGYSWRESVAGNRPCDGTNYSRNPGKNQPSSALRQNILIPSPLNLSFTPFITALTAGRAESSI
ncbi:MAG: hypothetical protein II837_14485 [Treponema sp.]|nr:hypothetical protein [Treponema sp.]